MGRSGWNRGKETVKMMTTDLTGYNSSRLIIDAERGLAQEEFFFLFQPKLRSEEGRISGFECLMRWQHPVDGVLEPSAFISVVADSELTIRFTDFLLAHAMDTLANWTARGYTNLSLAINLPAIEIVREDLPNKLIAGLACRDLDASRLQIELTEAAEPAELDSFAAAIDVVRGTGVCVALDDFGAGLTSLTLLHQLPVDIIKIGRSFIDGVPNNTEARFIVETLIRLGQRLGKQIVLKGIETEAQLTWARTLPFIDCQGFYISAPIPEYRIDHLIALHGQI